MSATKPHHSVLTWVMACIAGTFVGPLVVGWFLAAIRSGEVHIEKVQEVPTHIASRTPIGWQRMVTGRVMRWTGVVLTKFEPSRYPDCLECDVAVWELRSGWPLTCVTAYWNQDERPNEAMWLAPGSPFALDTPGENLAIHHDSSDRSWRSIFQTGLYQPSTASDAMSRRWIPMGIRLPQYAVNMTIYAVVLMGTCRAVVGLRNHITSCFRRRRDECASCGYSMRGSTSVCPECGRVNTRV